MDALFHPLAELTGASLDQLKLITCLLTSYPLGNIYVRLAPSSKHYFSVLVSVFYLIPMLHLYRGAFEILADILFTYVVAWRWKSSSKMPWVIFSAIMCHLLFNHVLRAFADVRYDTIEITGAQMVLTMKLTTFAFNVLDGQTPPEHLDKWQKAKQISQFPSILEFLGYSFYFPGLLVGPYLDFSQYMDLVHEHTLRDAAAKSQSKRNLPPGRKRAAYTKMLIGLVFLGLFVGAGGQYNFAQTLEPEFLEYRIWHRIALFQIYGVLERSKYYAVWSLTEGSSIVTGLGFSGFSPSGQPQWNGAANVNIPLIEFAPNFKVLVDSWNINTNIWLRECVYKRVTPAGKKPGFRSSMVTFATSALWHGIAPGYYLCFITAGFVTTLARLMRRHVRPLLLPHFPDEAPKFLRMLLKNIYDILGMIATILCTNYCAGAFMVLSFSDTFTLWTRLGFHCHILIMGGLIFFYTGGLKFFKIIGMNRVTRKEKEREMKQRKSENGNGFQLDDRPLSPSPTLQIPPPLDEVIPPPK